MALPPQKFREIVFQILYCQDMGHAQEKDIIELIMHELAVTKKNVLLGQERVKDILTHKNEVDEVIGRTALSYDFERIQSVERNILRLSCFEILFDTAIPPVVAIAEGVRLAKKFGTPESASFVNAILDAIYKISQGQPVDVKNIEQKTHQLKMSEEAANHLQNEPHKHERVDIPEK